MNLLCIIVIAILIIVGVSIIQNSKSTYVSNIKVKLNNVLTIEVDKKEKSSDKARESHPNTLKP